MISKKRVSFWLLVVKVQDKRPHLVMTSMMHFLCSSGQFVAKDRDMCVRVCLDLLLLLTQPSRYNHGCI